MKVSAVFLRSVILTAVVAFAGGCSDDDDGGNGPSAPAAPTGLAAVEQGDGSIRVTWNAVPDATSYTRTEPSTPGTFAQVGGALTTNSYSDTDVEPGISYGYRVSAVNAVGSSSPTATVNVTTAGAKVATLSGIYTTSRTLFADTVYTLQGFVQFPTTRC
jgi:hypothetical protein